MNLDNSIFPQAQLRDKRRVASQGRKAAMSKGNQHVVPHDGRWAVRGAGNTRVTSSHQTQNQAVNAAREIAMNQRSEVVIHRPDGRIRDKDSYGHDPMPPRDKKN